MKVNQLLFFAAIIALMNGCGSSIRHGPRISSLAHLHDIGVKIRNYQDEHGKLPPQLSDLVPNYFSTNEMAIFYVTNEYAQQIMPSDWNVNPKEINNYSSYFYLGINNTNGIIAFERTNLWKSTTTQSDKVAVLFSDFHVQNVSIAELQKLIK
jgi:hypothetical protein